MENLVDAFQGKDSDLDKLNKCPFEKLDDCTQYLIGIGTHCNNLRLDKLCGILSRTTNVMSCMNNVKCTGTLTLVKKGSE